MPRHGTEVARTVLSAWSWSVLAGLAIGGFGVQLPLAAATWSDKTRRVPGRFARDVAVLIAKINPMWDFRIHGELPSYRPSKTVVIANHVSNSDAFLISHLPWEMKWLGKSSLFYIPFVGWLMWLAGDVPVRRGAKGSVKDAMAHCREHLERGMPVMIFPEGTRSKTGELLPFKDGAFRLAIETGADILPIGVAGTKTALPKHSWRFGFSQGLVAVGEPIATEGMTLDDLPALKDRARARIEALLADLAQAQDGAAQDGAAQGS
ncbi:MAG: 1-acyl-sn-glycerol-3-phosphate acyltransferase [Myxococcales bacterium]|nr:1-acyl-sn-glycerol-3-phosphate acyltransferase [Myxococcales bacterium]